MIHMGSSRVNDVRSKGSFAWYVERRLPEVHERPKRICFRVSWSKWT